MGKQRTDDSTEKKTDSTWSGFFIAACFLVLGVILFYTPSYIGINGWIEKAINFFGWLAIIISFGCAFIELSNIFKNDGFSYIGVSFVFFVPAILLHILQGKSLSKQAGIIISKIIVIFFIIIGFGLLYGVSFFLGELNDESIKEEVVVVQRNKTKKSFIELISPIIIAILALVTAIFQFMSKISWESKTNA